MDNDAQEVAELIRSGAYFKEARRWYQSLYIAPIAERTFFLIVAILAGLTCLVSLIAVVGLLPITERPTVITPNMRMDETVPHISRIRPSRDMAMDPALIEFFARNYVQRREEYHFARYAADQAFIRAHSDPIVMTAYQLQVGRQNPQSWASQLGESGERDVKIRSVDVEPLREEDKGQPQSATIMFSTEFDGTANPSKTEWTAAIQFYYSPFEFTPVTDPKAGETYFKTTEPDFRVVSYAVTKAAPRY